MNHPYQDPSSTVSDKVEASFRRFEGDGDIGCCESSSESTASLTLFLPGVALELRPRAAFECQSSHLDFCGVWGEDCPSDTPASVAISGAGAKM